MKVVIDRFEGGFAVCEKPDKSMLDVEMSKLPPNVKEGDVLEVDGDRIVLDLKSTERQKKKIEELMNSLWK